ncbi:MAG: ethanolamine permease [Planctomycetales bacterium]|nr:ethanolamine permease [Planctomycetales bacterium]
MTSKNSGVVRYQEVDSDYLEKRKLRKSAGWVLLWAMGVGAVISGDYFGWNYGLTAGGFWGLAIGVFAMAVMYVCMVFSIAELSAALPHAGGFYSFVRNAMGPTAGFICGLTDTVEYVVTPAVIVIGISDYVNQLIFAHGEAPIYMQYVWWLAAYGLFVYINMRGVELTLRFVLMITAVAAAVLIVFYIGVISSGAFQWKLLFNVPPEPGYSATFLPKGWAGVFAALPSAIWFYLAIEQLPLAAEESHDAVKDMPKALILSILTLLTLSLFTLVLNSGVGGGAVVVGKSESPLNDGFRAVWGNGWMTRLMTFAALAGLIASFHSVIYAYGRVLFSLSRAGYFPRWISVCNRHNSPQTALILGAVVGLVCATLLALFEDMQVGQALLSMAVFGAVISYALVMASFVLLRIRRPELDRPYVSPLGIPGAILGGLLSIVAMVACFANEANRPGLYGTLLFLACGLAYYFAYSRHRLVAQAPEESIALKRN